MPRPVPYSGDLGAQAIESNTAELLDLVEAMPFCRGKRFEVTIASGADKSLSLGGSRVTSCLVLLCSGGPASIETKLSQDRESILVTNHHSSDLSLSLWLS